MYRLRDYAPLSKFFIVLQDSCQRILLRDPIFSRKGSFKGHNRQHNLSIYNIILSKCTIFRVVICFIFRSLSQQIFTTTRYCRHEHTALQVDWEFELIKLVPYWSVIVTVLYRLQVVMSFPLEGIISGHCLESSVLLYLLRMVGSIINQY